MVSHGVALGNGKLMLCALVEVWIHEILFQRDVYPSGVRISVPLMYVRALFDQSGF